jgi:hypothetical protein
MDDAKINMLQKAMNHLKQVSNTASCEKTSSVLATSAVDRKFKPRSGQTKDYKIGICCFSAKARSIKEKEQRLVGSKS